MNLSEGRRSRRQFPSWWVHMTADDSEVLEMNMSCVGSLYKLWADLLLQRRRFRESRLSQKTWRFFLSNPFFFFFFGVPSTGADIFMPTGSHGTNQAFTAVGSGVPRLETFGKSLATNIRSRTASRRRQGSLPFPPPIPPFLLVTALLYLTLTLVEPLPLLLSPWQVQPSLRHFIQMVISPASYYTVKFMAFKLLFSQDICHPHIFSDHLNSINFLSTSPSLLSLRNNPARPFTDG